MGFMGYRIRVFAAAMLLGAVLMGTGQLLAAESGSQLVMRELRGESLAHSLIGTNPVRKLAVYLPAGYEGAAKRYPVVYYLPSPGEFKEEFYEHDVRAVLDRATKSGTIQPVVLVAVDMATPVGCSWYVNSPVTGNWEDFMVRDVVPYVDANFKTLATRDSRGLPGISWADMGRSGLG